MTIFLFKAVWLGRKSDFTFGTFSRGSLKVHSLDLINRPEAICLKMLSLLLMNRALFEVVVTESN